MEINRESLKEAAAKGLVTELQAEQLWQFISDRHKDTPSFHFTHILYYLGGLIAIGAMSLFMNLGWERFGGWGLFGIALAYGMAGLWFTEFFLTRRHLQIPAGIMATFVVVLTPLAIYGLQVALGLWPEGHVYREYHTYIDWLDFHGACHTCNWRSHALALSLFIFGNAGGSNTLVYEHGLDAFPVWRS